MTTKRQAHKLAIFSAGLALMATTPAMAAMQASQQVPAAQQAEPRPSSGAPVSLLREETPLFTATLAARLAAGSNDPELASAAMTRAAASSGATDTVRLRAIGSAMDAGDFTAAANAANALSNKPTSGCALVALAAADFIRRDWRAVMRTLDETNAPGPEGLVARTMLAWSQYEAGRRDAAFLTLAAGTADSSFDVSGLASRALMLDVAGKRKEAIAAYQSLWELGLRYEGIGRRYATLLYRERQDAKAEDIIGSLLVETDDRAGLEALRANRGSRNARLAAGEARSISLTLMAATLLANAELAWPTELAIASGGSSGALRLMLASHYFGKENVPAAQAALRGIDTSQKEYPEAVAFLAQIQMEDDPAGALQAIDQALVRGPDNGQLLVAAGFAETRLKNYAGAIARYTSLIDGADAGRIRATPAVLANAHTFRATLRDMTGELDAAEVDYRAAVALAPEDASVLNGLGYFLADRNRNPQEANRLLLRAASMEPRNGSIIDSLGWAQYRLGNFEQAVGMLERALSLEPRQSVIADHLGDAYWRTGRLDAARMEWRKAIDLIRPGELGEPDPAALEAKIRDGLPPLPAPPERASKTDI